MYKEQIEILDAWKNFLSEIETKMQLSIKTILNETKELKNIHAMFFEYEYNDMDLMFWALDKKENVLFKKLDILNGKINGKHLFPNDLMERQMDIDDEYDGEDDNYDDFRDEYSEEKEEIFKKWFMLCWDNIKEEYKNIPEVYFSIHDTNWKTNLNTKGIIEHDNIFK
ncbi:MAG: hypothetical protein LBU76_01285 [Azoarcus sp.]|jgi:hypothetical protein|nr:hypothetical protein [Azoarcus sp.]